MPSKREQRKALAEVRRTQELIKLHTIKILLGNLPIQKPQFCGPVELGERDELREALREYAEILHTERKHVLAPFDTCDFFTCVRARKLLIEMKEPKSQDVPEVLNRITDIVVNYRPKSKRKKPRKRKRQKR